jgi:hypothetical protein
MTGAGRLPRGEPAGATRARMAGVQLLIRPEPARRKPVQLGLTPDRVEAVDRRGRQHSWPRAAVGRLRLTSIGVTETDAAGLKVPVANGLAVDGADGAELIRLAWWGIGHEQLEQGAAAVGLPLVYAEGRPARGGQSTVHRPQWKEPTSLALVLGPVEVIVTDRSGRQASWPRVGHLSGGGRATPPGAVVVPPVARLRLYRDYNTGSWLKAVSLVDPWRRELVLLRWDTLAAAGSMHDAACAAGLLPEFCWESALPGDVGTGRVPLIV